MEISETKEMRRKRLNREKSKRWRERNPERAKEQYRKANRKRRGTLEGLEKYNNYMKEWHEKRPNFYKENYAKNREKKIQQTKECYQRHRKKYLERMKRWREKNRERLNQNQRLKYKENLEKSRQEDRDYTRKSVEENHRKLGSVCFICGKIRRKMVCHEVHGKRHSCSPSYTKNHIEDFVLMCSYCHDGFHIYLRNKEKFENLAKSVTVR